MRLAVTWMLAGSLWAGYHPPGGDRFATLGANGAAILPGGRVIQPVGEQVLIGPGPFRLAVSPSGTSIASANAGPERASLAVLTANRKDAWQVRHLFGSSELAPQSEFTAIAGLTFAGEKRLWVSEGATGQVLLVDWETGSRKARISINSEGVAGSFAGALDWDNSRSILYIVDRVHSRVVRWNAERGEFLASIPVHETGDITLSPDGVRGWIGGQGLQALDLRDVSHPKASDIALPPDLSRVGRIVATERAVFVSYPEADEVLQLDPEANVVRSRILLRIPGLEQLRGIAPLGMAWDGSARRLYVAESGINAVAVVDMAAGQVIGHLPVGWAPADVAIRNGKLLVANRLGRGAGPSSLWVQPDAAEFAGVSGRGSISLVSIPQDAELAKQSHLVLAANGMLPPPDPVPPQSWLRSVIFVVKGSRSFDEVLGDLQVPGSQVAGNSKLARFGKLGYAEGGKGRFSLQKINITPNQHALAEQFAASDNFYADGEDVGALLPRPFAEYLAKHGCAPEEFGASGDHDNASDQVRADRFIAMLQARYEKTGQELPRFLVVHLPNDSGFAPRPSEGFPYSASYVADTDVAVGKLVEYLSHSRWWPHLALLVMNGSAAGTRDHVDAHRTVFLAAGAHARNGFVSHLNANFASVRKTVLQLLGLPAFDLNDATASSLLGLFSDEENPRPFSVQEVDPHLLESQTSRTSNAPGRP